MQSLHQYRQLRAVVETQRQATFRNGEPNSEASKESEEGVEQDRFQQTDVDGQRRAEPSPTLSRSPTLDGRFDVSNESAHERDTNTEKHDENSHYRVGFESDQDPLNPKNWSLARKWQAMGIVATPCFIVGWGSSIDSAVLAEAAREFGVSEVVESLAGTGIFLVAFGLGSLVAGPFSETVGRNPVYIVSLSLYMVFTMASGLAPNIGAQIAFRFIAGLFGCTPLTTFGGSMSDLFYPLDRTYVFPVCASLAFLGPFLAPMVGSFIGASTHITWRWTEWVTLIITGAITLAIFLFVPETYAPILLKWKAEHLRKVTGDNRYRAEIEARQISFLTRLMHNITRPIQMLFSEIMVTLFTLYITVVYIVLFGFLVGYDFIYGKVYHFSQGSVGLTFLGMNVGFLIAFAIVPFIYMQYARKIRRAQSLGLDAVEPEQRLWYAMIGAPFLPISLFWMAWTAYSSISYWSPLVASVCFGFAVQAIFISTCQYLIDSYEMYAASALAAATLVRYLAAGGMQVVSLPMYKNLGVHWTLTLLGCIATLMTPVPYVFYFFGVRIRKKCSKKATEEDGC